MESYVLNIKLNQSVFEPAYCTADLGLCVLLQQLNASFRAAVRYPKNAHLTHPFMVLCKKAMHQFIFQICIGFIHLDS